MLVKHLWWNGGTQHQQGDSWNLNKKLSADCCKSGAVINPTLRLNNFKHKKKNDHWPKIFQKQYSQERILTVAFHSGESLWKNTVSSNESIEVDTASWAWWDIIIIDGDATLRANIFYETDQRYQHQGQSSDHRYKEIDWDEETYGEYD